MDVYHWPSPAGNFGDDLNTWLWDFLLPGYRGKQTDTLIVGVGTVLDTALLPEKRKKLVLGSGTGYGTSPSVANKECWDVRCVRGPLSAEKLGLSSSLGIIDPAVLISDMEQFQNLPKKHGTVFVPHWESAIHGCWDEVCERVDISYVDPCADAHEVISTIAQSSLVIAESMHAAILADAFRVPWIAVTTSKQINPFKWQDWARSLEMNYHPQLLSLSSPMEAGAKGESYYGLRWPKTGEQGVAASDPTASENTAETTTLKTRLKVLLSSRAARKIFIIPAVNSLKKSLKAEPQLSNEEVLSRQKARFYDVMECVKRDYGI